MLWSSISLALEDCGLLKLVAAYSRQVCYEGFWGLKRGSVLRGRKDFGRFASQKDVDAVIIALPIPVQPSIIKRCLLAGKHALSDKSIAPGLKQVQELLDWYAAIFQPEAAWAVAEKFRFMEAYKYEREVVEKMGRMLAFSVFAGNYKPNGVKSPPTKAVSSLTVVFSKLPPSHPTNLQ